jgi:hypothetical protein
MTTIRVEIPAISFILYGVIPTNLGEELEGIETQAVFFV